MLPPQQGQSHHEQINPRSNPGQGSIEPRPHPGLWAVGLLARMEVGTGVFTPTRRGNKAFLSDSTPVPFVINNDGTLSRNAAEVFFASLVDSEKNTPLTAGSPLTPDPSLRSTGARGDCLNPTPEPLFVLELGIGVGLFARYFLDAFRDLCQQHNKDYYGRLCYIAADRSKQMLLDVCRHGVLANHPGRYVLRVVDAMAPDKGLLHDVLFQNSRTEFIPFVTKDETNSTNSVSPEENGINSVLQIDAGQPLRAVFLNYLLDCLPAAVLEMDGDRVKQLHVRTCVARNVKLEEHTDFTVE